MVLCSNFFSILFIEEGLDKNFDAKYNSYIELSEFLFLLLICIHVFIICLNKIEFYPQHQCFI